MRAIDATMPYPRDADEGYVSGPAVRIVQTGTWHPYIFNYPSLAKYLAATGMAAGFISSASHLEIREVRRIGNVGYPYYETPRVMRTARLLFASLSIVMLFMTGMATWHLFEIPSLMLLVPLILETSALFFYHSWTYLNVDIVGAAFATCAVGAVLYGTRFPSLTRSAILPGVFAGLAAGGKYTMVIVIVPALLAIVFYVKPGRRVWTCAAAVASMIAAFVVVTPYSLWDIPGFLNGVASEAFHYARGHNGADGPPGLPQIAYYTNHFREEFGIAGLAIASAGALAFAAADWRRAAIVASFPIVMAALLYPQRTHFARNVLSLHPIVAMFIGYGLLRVHAWMMATAIRRGWVMPERQWLVRALLALALFIAAVPIWNLRDQLRDRTDSRTVALDFIDQRIPKDWSVVVPTELGVDVRPLQEKGMSVTTMDLKGATDPDALRREVSGVRRPAIILLPRWGADLRTPGKDQADALNKTAQLWQKMRVFGTEPVLVNYASPTPAGDPAFDISVIDRPGH